MVWYDSSDGDWRYLAYIQQDEYDDYEKEIENMARKRDTVYLHGTVNWAKIFGPPRPNYDGDAREWTIEFTPDDDGRELLAEHGLTERLKTSKKEPDRPTYLILRRDEFNFEGKPNDPIRVVDAANQPWDEKKLLGNGTEVDFKINIVDYGKGKNKGIYPQAIRVLELVPYVSEEFKPLDSEDPRVKKAKESTRTTSFEEDFGIEDPAEEATPTVASSADDLDDDVPFD